jgi:hypothetical protein
MAQWNLRPKPIAALKSRRGGQAMARAEILRLKIKASQILSDDKSKLYKLYLLLKGNLFDVPILRGYFKKTNLLFSYTARCQATNK